MHVIDLRTLHNTAWLTEPAALRRIVARVASYRGCYSAREVAKHRRNVFDRWAASPQGQGIAGTGVTESVELPHSLVKMAQPTKAIRAVKGKVGVIPLHGPIGQHMTSELMKAGGVSCDFVSQALDKLLNDDGVDAVVLHCDSPGGYSYGVQELGDKLYDARARKPIYAIADSMACSAAMWIASSATMLLSTPGGDVGSVGVYVVHVDESVANEMQGLNVTLIKAGKNKAEFAPFAPLSDDALAAAQESVDADYSRFIDALKRNRGTTADDVKANYGQGRCLAAPDALRVGAIDRVMTFEQLVAKLTGSAGPSSPARAASVGMLRLRQEQRLRQCEILRAAI